MCLKEKVPAWHRTIDKVPRGMLTSGTEVKERLVKTKSRSSCISLYENIYQRPNDLRPASNELVFRSLRYRSQERPRSWRGSVVDILFAESWISHSEAFVSCCAMDIFQAEKLPGHPAQNIDLIKDRTRNRCYRNK